MSPRIAQDDRGRGFGTPTRPTRSRNQNLGCWQPGDVWGLPFIRDAGYGFAHGRAGRWILSSELDPIFGCDLVTTRLDRDGYAYHGKSRAHVVAWINVHGPLPDGMEIDHLCRRRNCRALAHLEMVTRSENERRKSWRHRVKRSRCARGHDLSLHGIVTPEGGRICRACNAENIVDGNPKGELE